MLCLFETLNTLLHELGMMDIVSVMPQNPGVLLTTRQPEKFLSFSGDSIPHCLVPFTGIHIFTKIGQSLLCSRSSTHYTTCITIYLGPIQGLNRSNNDHTWPICPYPQYITISQLFIRVYYNTVIQNIY